MGTNTTNYSFSKPTVDGDEDTWGTQLNGNWDKTDSLLSGGQDISSLSITTSVTLKGQADLVLKDADSSHSVSLQAPATIGTNFTLTLPAADGSSGQVIQTDGSGNLSFVDQSGGGGSGDSIADADGDTKIQVEKTTDDDTIRFDTAGSERMSILSSGNILIGKSASDTNASGLELYNDGAIALARSGRPLYANRLSSEGNVIDVAKDGTLIGSIGVIATNNLYLSNAADGIGLGIGDDNLYPVNGTGGANGSAVDIGDITVPFRKLFLSGDLNSSGGQASFGTADIGTETLTINKVGSSTYGSIQIRRSDTDNTNNGGFISFAQKDVANTSWAGLAGWDNGTNRTVYLGGGGWGKQEATAIVLYTGSYDAGSGGASERLRIKPTGQSLFKHDVYSLGQIRATGWYNTPTGTTGTGAAMEIGVSGTTAYVHGYNRDAGSYVPVNMTGQGITLNAQSTDPQVTLVGSASQVIRYTGSATSPYMRFTTSGTANGYIQFTTSHSYFWNDRASRGIRISSGGLPYFYNGSSYDELHRNSYSVDMIANQAYSDNWFRCNGDQGLYWQGRGRGITSPEQQGNSYGNTTTYGSGRSSWQGWGISNDYTFMGRNDTDMGCHDTGYGWAWYWHSGNDGMGVGTSSTSSSYRLYVSGQIYATSNITAYSDRRSKENIVTIDNALDKTLAMRGVYYNRRFGEDKSRQVGVIAQEMLEPEACPEAVTYAEDVDEYGVSYGNLVGVLIEAIKELKGQVDDLQAQVQELQG